MPCFRLLSVLRRKIYQLRRLVLLNPVLGLDECKEIPTTCGQVVFTRPLVLILADRQRRWLSWGRRSASLAFRDEFKGWRRSRNIQTVEPSREIARLLISDQYHWRSTDSIGPISPFD